MQYLLLIYGEEQLEPTGDDVGPYMQAYQEFTESIVKTGEYKGGEALEPVATATTVAVRDGEAIVTDGPFAETREQLGGFYLIDTKDLDSALAIAARIPTAKHGRVEVRPIMTWDEPAS